MKVGIIDADLIGRKRHRFPNLASMKIAGYYKDNGATVELITDYSKVNCYDQLFLSKVFTDTQVPDWILEMPNLQYGGTGFFYDKAPVLPADIEHHMPDYYLYDLWVSSQLAVGKRKQEFKYYTDYSIGVLTRGCFRQCAFCVNKNYKRVQKHSPLEEFYDPTRKKICLLDDNFLGCPGWKDALSILKTTQKPFQFKQGLDERLLTEEKCEVLFSSKYDGDFIFAFDNVADAALIESKIKMARKYTSAVFKFYCFCGFDRNGQWDEKFWEQDIFDLFTRIEILMKNRCLPYVMRFARYIESPYRGMYITIARWCNQPSFFKKKSLREFAVLNGVDSACFKYMADFESRFPPVTPYLDMKYK